MLISYIDTTVVITVPTGFDSVACPITSGNVFDIRSFYPEAMQASMEASVAYIAAPPT